MKDESLSLRDGAVVAASQPWGIPAPALCLALPCEHLTTWLSPVFPWTLSLLPLTFCSCGLQPGSLLLAQDLAVTHFYPVPEP